MLQYYLDKKQQKITCVIHSARSIVRDKAVFIPFHLSLMRSGVFDKSPDHPIRVTIICFDIIDMKKIYINRCRFFQLIDFTL